MAFGDQKAIGVAILTGASIGASNPIAIQTPPVVAVGDLVVALMAQQTALTASGCTDNLGNTYVAQNAGTLSGTTISGRLFYSRVTVPGTLSSVTIAATASANDFSCLCAVFTGPFVTSPVDSSPANGTTDITTPYSCPASATLAQASELVIGWSANNAAATWAASSPFTLTNQTNQANTHAVISHLVTSATTAQTPAFTGTAPTATVLGTLTFKADLNQALTPGKYTDNDTYSAPALSGDFPGIAEAGMTPLYVYRSRPIGEVIDIPRQQPGALTGLTPGLISDADSFIGPALGSTIGLTPGKISDADSWSSPTAGQVLSITPNLIPYTDAWYSPAVALGSYPSYAAASAFYRRRRIPHSSVIQTFTIPNAGIVTPQRLADSDTFFGPTLSTSKNLLAQNSFNDVDTFFIIGLSTTTAVLSSLFVDSDIFSAPNFGAGFTTTLFADSDVFFSPLIGPRPGLFIDTDRVFAPSFVGGVSVAQPLIIDSDTFFAPLVSTLKQTAPVFFIDSDVIFVPGLAATRALTPSLLVDADAFSSIAVIYNFGTFFFGDADSFYSPSLVGGTVGATPGLLTDVDWFYGPSLQGIGTSPIVNTYAAASERIIVRRFIPPMSVTVVIRSGNLDIRPGGRYVDTDTIFSVGIGGGQFIVVPAVYAESDTHYSPTVVGGELKRIYHESDSSPLIKNRRYVPPPMSVTVVIRGPAQGQLVVPTFFSDSDTFFSPTLAVGAVNITPTLFIDSDSPRMALVTGGGAQPTMAGRINDADNFFVPALAAGTVNVIPLTFTDTDVFFDPITGLFVGPSKFTDADAVFNPVVLAVSDIQPVLFVDSDVFFAPALTVSAVNISPFPFVDTDILRMPSVGSKVDPVFFADTSTFYSPTVVQRNELFPNLISDADRLFTPQLVYDQFISASKMTDADTLFEPFFPHDPRYTYPIGHGMLSDYSIRRPRQGRVIIGRH